MKFTLLKPTLVGLLLTLSTFSNASIISVDDYQLTDIAGSFTWGNTNWNLEAGDGYVNNSSDLALVDSLLSDGYEFSTGDDNPINGIYNWTTAGYHALTFTFDTETTFSEFDLLISRNNSLATPFFAEIFSNGIWSSLADSTTGALGATLRPGNNSDITQTLNLDLGLASGTAFRFGFDGGDQVALHEVTFTGVSEEIPEPTTLAIFALGVIGLASRRIKKES